jgi:ubiquinone/menaquinone biosynthesis C-methylase UbiE
LKLHYIFLKSISQERYCFDAGGGPRRYTVELAKQGHKIVLLDISKSNLEFAKKQIAKLKLQNKVKNIVEGSILNLSILSNESFDMVTCLGGPLPISKEKKTEIRLLQN